MASQPKAPRDDNAFARLYPNLTGPELEEAEENFTRYLNLAIRIWTRIEADPAALAHLRELTRERSRRYDDDEGSHPASFQSHP